MVNGMCLYSGYSTHGVVAHRVEVTHLVTFTVALQVAGFFLQGHKNVHLYDGSDSAPHRHRGHSADKRWSVGHSLTAAIRLRCYDSATPATAAGERWHAVTPVAITPVLSCWFKVHAGRLKPLRSFAGCALPMAHPAPEQCSRCDPAPARLCVLTARGTDFSSSTYRHRICAIDQQFNVVGRLFVQGPVFQRFHVYIHSQARFARRSAIKVTRKKAPIRSKKPMAINRGLKPILSAVTPIIRENRKLAIHAAEPRMPLTVAI